MKSIEIDPSLLQQLSHATPPVVLCDSNNRVLGYFVPEPNYQGMHRAVENQLGAEELTRRLSAPNTQTLDEIWDELQRRED